MFYPKVVFKDKLLGKVLPMYGIVFNKLHRERKLDGPAKKDYVIHVQHFIYLPPFLLADFKEQAGRTQGVHNHVCAPSVYIH
jgi:hypothetical protein